MLQFAPLIVAGFVDTTVYRPMTLDGLTQVNFRLSEKGKMFVDAWKKGDAIALAAAQAFVPPPSHPPAQAT